VSARDEPHTNDLAALERLLPQLACDHPADLLARLQQVVTDNIRSGRWDRVRARAPVETLAHYVRRVAALLQVDTAWHGDLATKDEAAWAKLLKLLRTRAFHRLRRLGVPTVAANARAEDHAQRTCLAIIEAQPYPYDVPYLAWVSKILNNAIQADTSRSRDLLDHEERLRPELPAVPGEDEVEADPSTQDQAERLENRVDVQRALAQLPIGQRVVIERTLAQEISVQEIAAELNISEQAVYNLRHRGRKRLETLLKNQ